MSPMIDEPIETFLNEKQLAERLGVSISTLRLWRSERKGPSYHKIGQLVRYSPTVIREWLLRQQAGGDLNRVGEVR
jgi:predicted DNA-binding transcriptional regulator AlpA